MKRHCGDEAFDGPLQRTLARCDAGMAKVGDVSTSQGRQPFDAVTCPKTLRSFTRAEGAEGAEGHCEGMVPIVFWTAAFDWLEATLR